MTFDYRTFGESEARVSAASSETGTSITRYPGGHYLSIYNNKKIG